jgi:benzoyl-CoA 2,3-dioxygenase component B
MSLTDAIPNNVDLGADRRLLRALEHWRPSFLDWWRDMGPEGFQEDLIWLRTATSVDAGGWANWDYVRLCDYRWGIFLTPPRGQDTVGFGDTPQAPVWDEVPGELRGMLRRIIVTQADTEPASVEQQRRLGQTAPSLFDLRNLFQVNVEEGRHLWAMVHLLHRHFGRDGREEADALLERRSGDPDKPRILGTFNEKMDDWLSFFMFTMFTDRDGKYQLAALAESGFDPLARTARFMLTEEAFHLAVGEAGIDRVVRRAAEATRRDPNGDARAEGAVDLPTIQKYINHWFSSSVELFGGELSSNAADVFSAGLKGRFRERSKYADHRALDGTYPLVVVGDGNRLETRSVPLRTALNEVLRDEYVDDCRRACRRWNRTLREAGVDDGTALRIPSRRFHRRIGLYARHHFDPAGQLIDAATWAARRDEWLPTDADQDYVRSLMTPVREPGCFARWIAPPSKGLRGTPIDFPYVRFARAA